MCGIAGILDVDANSETLEQRLGVMLRQISHRGPDHEGHFVQNGVALGNQRLKIIDLEGGDQPVWNEDHTVVTLYNGEIYNFRELRNELESKGHLFSTKSDTEILVHVHVS